MQTPRLKKRTRANGTDCYYTDLRGRQVGLGSDYPAAKKRSAELLAGREPDEPKFPEIRKITVGELIDRYLRHAAIYYCKNGAPTDEQNCIRAALPTNLLVRALLKNAAIESRQRAFWLGCTTLLPT